MKFNRHVHTREGANPIGVKVCGVRDGRVVYVVVKEWSLDGVGHGEEPGDGRCEED
jgi:hypothetical protein